MVLRCEREVQGDLVVTWAEMPRSPGQAFYDKLQKLLNEAGPRSLSISSKYPTMCIRK